MFPTTDAEHPVSGHERISTTLCTPAIYSPMSMQLCSLVLQWGLGGEVGDKTLGQERRGAQGESQGPTWQCRRQRAG